jgi:hypothetical protein
MLGAFGAPLASCIGRRGEEGRGARTRALWVVAGVVSALTDQLTAANASLRSAHGRCGPLQEVSALTDQLAAANASLGALRSIESRAAMPAPAAAEGSFLAAATGTLEHTAPAFPSAAADVAALQVGAALQAGRGSEVAAAADAAAAATAGAGGAPCAASDAVPPSEAAVPRLDVAPSALRAARAAVPPSDTPRAADASPSAARAAIPRLALPPLGGSGSSDAWLSEELAALSADVVLVARLQACLDLGEAAHGAGQPPGKPRTRLAPTRVCLANGLVGVSRRRRRCMSRRRRRCSQGAAATLPQRARCRAAATPRPTRTPPPLGRGSGR